VEPGAQSVEVGQGPVSRTSPPGAPSPGAPSLPAGALQDFTAALGASQLASAAACFTREGCLVTPDGTAVHGREEISSVLAQLIARRTEIDVEQVVVRAAGDVAFASGSLTMSSDGPDETRFAQTRNLNLVLHRIEAEWKIAILAPWGAC
jgi:uncharacterized protein (TIGR02246 family)